jgi:hypothetical protein
MTGDAPHAKVATGIKEQTATAGFRGLFREAMIRFSPRLQRDVAPVADFA